jgi:hypothetical protein
MQKKWIFFAGIVLLFLAAGWGYYMYQKPRAGVASVKSAYSLSAEELYQDFVQDEAAATEKYTGKVIEVSGVVSDVQAMDSAMIVLLSAGNEAGGVNCSFSRNEQKAIPQKGERITVKGRCAGFLMDVNLVDAIQKD